MIRARGILTGLIALLCGCNTGHEKPVTVSAPVVSTLGMVANKAAAPEPDTTFRAKQIPVIAYHQLRDWKESDTRTDKVYILPPASFRAQIQMLHDSGYNSILPDALIAYLEKGTQLPPHPVMITFDDATGPQYEIGMTELNKYGFKGVFFIMTVVLDRPGYMTRQMIKDIAAQGHKIECHTWDHHMVTKYQEKDWVLQLEKPTALLESLTGQPVKYFAYPYGLWNEDAIEHLKKYGFTAAFQLSEKRDAHYPLYTIRRIIADGNWGAAQLNAALKRDFK